MGFWGKQLNYFDKGKFIISNIQWIATLAILFKVYNLEDYLILGTIILISGTWIVGWFTVRFGLWDSFVRETNKGLKQWFNKGE